MPVYIYQCQGLKQITTNKQRRQEWVVIYITLHLNVDSYTYNYKYNYKNIQILTAFYVMTPQTSSSCPKPACEAIRICSIDCILCLSSTSPKQVSMDQSVRGELTK